MTTRHIPLRPISPPPVSRCFSMASRNASLSNSAPPPSLSALGRGTEGEVFPLPCANSFFVRFLAFCSPNRPHPGTHLDTQIHATRQNPPGNRRLAPAPLRGRAVPFFLSFVAFCPPTVLTVYTKALSKMRESSKCLSLTLPAGTVPCPRA
jgi:hypothetical protein